ncbi:3-phosphoshikimate 1-carboxyvinyltransferase [Flavobacterium sp.]|uniref:3-phosphoshikimate 1-carboxyvinyltransferase n=1 Tax=Flavobacterium sp. TaxID=239 RepID=UPI0028BE7F1B|nr:3-phosphoshikimate 1-carboxyvinyltransferase [Flavobacterium sp.]
MKLFLQKSEVISEQAIGVSGSKSETNRLLLLKALYPELVIENGSNSDDSEVMQKVLQSDNLVKDIHHAGTAMRFLTAYYAIQEGEEVLLTGSSRMKERPIQILVEALGQLGAEISYEEKEGFPPIKIKGKKLSQNKVSLAANVSSQYISALLLIAPKLENGLELTLEGEITSVPYIKMTLALLNEIGVKTSFEENVIKVHYKSNVESQKVIVESDWSSASYWYSIVALAEIGTKITLSSYKKNSLQGDAILARIYQDFGVETGYNENGSITLFKATHCQLSIVNYHLNNCPDIAQTIAVTCFGLGIACDLYGLHTLKIKETDRLEALKIELTNLGAEISIIAESLHLKASTVIHENVAVKTYQDHRMAMAFAPLALKIPIIIEEAEVVSKSYPNFWNDLQKSGFRLSEVL